MYSAWTHYKDQAFLYNPKQCLQADVTLKIYKRSVVAYHAKMIVRFKDILALIFCCLAIDHTR